MKKFSLLLALLLLLTTIPAGFGAVAEEADAEEMDLLFELTEEEVDSFLLTMASDGHQFLRRAWNDGRPEFSKSAAGGIRITNRDADWQSLDIRHEWMADGATYKIVVEFASDDPVDFKITNTDAPYGVVLAGTDSPSTSAVLEYEMSFLNSTDGQRGVRLTTHPHTVTVDYTIRNIKIYGGEIDENAVPRQWAMDIPSLKQTYSEFFPVGNILEPQQLDNDEMITMYLHQYNAVTAENAMKPQSIAPDRDTRNFEGTDRLVDWAVSNGVEMHGHTLVWHSQSAPWLTTGADGEPLTRAEAQENMRNYIDEVAGRYSGRVASWDVVNEAFNDSVSAGGSWQSGLRTNSPWYRAYANGMNEDIGEAPEDYLYDAFVFARLAAPDAVLFYNDFNEEFEGKRNAIASMVEELNARWLDDERNEDKERLLVEVIGMQAHYWTDHLDPSDVRASIERFIETGAKVAVTELDIPIGSYSGFATYSEGEILKQASLYASLFKIYTDYADDIVRVSFWGKADHQSWRSEGYPLLFDDNLQPKPAFYSIIEVLVPPVAIDTLPEEIVPDAEPDTAPVVDEPSATPSISDPVEISEPEFPWVAIIIGTAVLIIGVVIIVVVRRKR